MRIPLLALCLFGALSANVVRADLVSPYGGETAPNFAELNVLEDRVRVVLEIDRADFPIFVTASDGSGAGLAERTGRTFRVLADEEDLAPQTRVVDLRQRKARRTAATPLVAPRSRSAEVIYAELDFLFSTRPNTVTFVPPLDDKGRPIASIGVLAMHLDVPVTDYRYLSQPETIRLNWDDPWFTRFDNPNLTRHHASPLMSFITVEPREVRHEMILRLSDLEGWADLDLGEAAEIGSAEMRHVSDAARGYLAERNPVTIDGAAAAPGAISVARIAVGAEGLRVLPEEAITARRTTLLGVILSYPRPALANTVLMSWDLFPFGVDAVPVTLTDPAGGVPAQVRRDDPVVGWKNHLRTWRPLKMEPVLSPGTAVVEAPLLSGALALGALALITMAVRPTRRRPKLIGASIALGLAVAASPVTSALQLPSQQTLDEATAQTVLTNLIENAGVALLEVTPAAYGAALIPFVSDEALEPVGREILRGLAVTLPSGARGRMTGVSALSIEEINVAANGKGTTLLARWQARTSGGHWGHLHQRTITYRALAEVRPENGAWKLSALTVLRAE